MLAALENRKLRELFPPTPKKHFFDEWE